MGDGVNWGLVPQFNLAQPFFQGQQAGTLANLVQARQQAGQLAQQGQFDQGAALALGAGDTQTANTLYALANRNIPQGFQKNPDGGVAPIQGGPNDPNYLSQVANAGAKPTFTTIGHDRFGNATYGFVDPQKGTATPIQPQGGTAQQSSAPGTGLSGDQFLTSIDKPTADQVKALAEGRMAFPAGMALKSPYWQQMLSMVSQYDPNFDAVNYNSRSKTRNDFTSGKSAQNITALNTVIGHMGTLMDKADQLNNGSIPIFNTVANSVESAIGDPRLNNFNLARNAVSDELAKVFRSAGMSDHEIAQWKGTLDSSASPDQIKGAVATGLHLLDSRMQSVGDQYNRGMGTTSDPTRLLSPKAQQVLNDIRKRVGEPGITPQEQIQFGGRPQQSQQTQPAQQGGTPRPIGSQQEYQSLPSGSQYVAPDGSIRTKQ